MQAPRLWLTAEAVQTMRAEAERAHPYETGGMLLGWDNPDRREVVVVRALGPGPNAAHEQTTFQADGAWQQAQLDTAYERTDGRVSFLGDWHVHPAGGLGLSQRDRRTMALVADSAQARCRRPVTVLLARTVEGGGYQLGAWMWRASPWPFIRGAASTLPVSVWTPDASEQFWEPAERRGEASP